MLGTIGYEDVRTERNRGTGILAIEERRKRDADEQHTQRLNRKEEEMLENLGKYGRSSPYDPWADIFCLCRDEQKEK